MYWKLSNNLIESVRGHIKYLESVEPSEPKLTVEEIDLKIEEDYKGLLQYWLCSFQGSDAKLERFFAKNQLQSNEIFQF